MPSAMALSPMPAPKPTSAAKGGIAATILLALLGVYVNEGGFVDDPADRGGATRYGITEKVARAWGYKGKMRDFPKHCDAVQRVCADLIYRTDYMEKPGFMPMALAEPAVFYEMVDSAVLHGAPRASGWFQGGLNSVCGTTFRGFPSVQAVHVKAYTNCADALGRVKVCVRMLDAMDAGQRKFFDRIIANNPSQRRFYKGWTRARLNNVDRKKCGGHAAP